MKRIKNLSNYVTLKQTALQTLVPKTYQSHSGSIQLLKYTVLSMSHQNIFF
jgi:hypothetical protein